ncbi:hypothetical protein D9M69_715770 [compost metagenome]
MLALAFQVGFQFGSGVEVVFDCAFVAPCHENKVGDAGGDGFFHGILDQRFVDHGQHFLGHRLGGGQEARAHAGDRENGFTDGTH